MKRRLPYFCLFCVFERFTVNLYGVFGNGDAVKRLCRSTNFGFIQCVRPCSHAQNCSSISFGSRTLQNSAQSSFKKLSGPLHRVEITGTPAASASTAGMPNVSISEAIKRASVWLKNLRNFTFGLAPDKGYNVVQPELRCGLFIKRFLLPVADNRIQKRFFRVLLPQELQGLQSVFHAFAGAQCGNRRQAKMCRVFRFFLRRKMPWC